MASTNKTSHYNLSQYIGTDKPTYLVDYNTDMNNIDNAIYSADNKATQNTTNMGDITTLTTTDKSSIVNAINETNQKTETNTSNIGLLSNLNTTNKTNVVSAINEINNKFGNLADLLYPVGSLYINTTNVNPSTFLGGTWELFAPGRVLVGYDSSDTDFDTLLETGGSKEMQSHNHKISVNASGDTQQPNSTLAIYRSDYYLYGKDQAADTFVSETVGAGNSGNLQPYIVVSMWKRTA